MIPLWMQFLIGLGALMVLATSVFALCFARWLALELWDGRRLRLEREREQAAAREIRLLDRQFTR